MAERKSAWDNIVEDFGWLLDRSSYDMPALISPSVNDYTPQPAAQMMTPPNLTPSEQEAYIAAASVGDRRTTRRLEGISNGRMSGGGGGLRNTPVPDAMTTVAGLEMPGMGGGVGLEASVPDAPVIVAPYGITPELPVVDVIADLQSQDQTRASGGSRNRKDDRGLGMTYEPLFGNPLLESVPDPENRRRTMLVPKSGEELVPPKQYDDVLTGDPDVYQAGDEYAFPAVTSLRPKLRPDGLVASPNVGSESTSSGKDAKPATTQGDAGSGGTGKANAGLETDAEEAEEELNAIQRFVADKFGMDEDQRSDLAKALIMGGAAAMSSDSSDFWTTIGRGVGAGAQAYYGAEDDRVEQARKDELMDMKRKEFDLATQKQQFAIQEAQKKLGEYGKGFGDLKSTAGKRLADAYVLSQRLGIPMEEAEKLIAQYASMGKSSDDILAQIGA